MSRFRSRRIPGSLIAAVGFLVLPPIAGAIPEQVGRYGVGTFTNYHNASGVGPRIAPYATVEVSCKVLDGTIVSANPDGYWYRIATAPWSDQYYSPANTFYNGDPVNGPYTHNTDFSVPDCAAAPQPPPPPRPAPSVTVSQGPPATVGFRYAITFANFAPNSSVSVSCRDSVDPGGFFTFSLGTDGNGAAFTQSQCFSADGPQHWVVAGGVESNRVSWGGAGPAPTGGAVGGGNNSATTPGGTVSGQTSPAQQLQPALSGVQLQALPAGLTIRLPTGPAAECREFSGVTIGGAGAKTSALYSHYLWGGGVDVILDWSYFSVSNPEFVAFARNIPVGSTASFTPGNRLSDLYLSMGTFEVGRTSATCYYVSDLYDFAYQKPSDIFLTPFWLQSYVGARVFMVHATGRL